MSGYIVARCAADWAGTLTDALRWLDVMDAAWSLRPGGANGWGCPYRL